MKRYKRKFKTQVIKEDAEEDKSIKMIKDLIDLDWEKDEDAQHQALAMVKGLVLADTKSADKFLTDLSTYTSKMSIEDYSGKQEEGCKKKPKKKGMKEATFNVNSKLSAQETIESCISYLLQGWGYKNVNLYRNLGFSIWSGIVKGFTEEGLTNPDDMMPQTKFVIANIVKNLKSRV